MHKKSPFLSKKMSHQRKAKQSVHTESAFDNLLGASHDASIDDSQPSLALDYNTLKS